MRKTTTVDQANIALTRKQFSEQLISALADYGDMPANLKRSSLTSITLASKDYGSNRLFQFDLKDALEKDAAYTAKPFLQGLLTAAQLVMIRGRRMPSDNDNVPSLVLTRSARESPHRQSTRADAPSIPDKATVDEHCQGCGRPRHTRDECRSRDIPRGPLDRLQSLQSRGRHQCR